MSLPFRYAGTKFRKLRRMSAGERSAWYPPVSKEPPIAEVRNDQLYKEIRGEVVDFEDNTVDLPHSEYFKMYFGWLGSAEINFGRNRDEFDIAYRALLSTIQAIDVGDDIAPACQQLYEDLEEISSLRGPRDYVFTVRDDTGRMWLELRPGVYIQELWETPHIVASSSFPIRMQEGMEDDDVGVILPREATYLFRRGELLGTEDVWIPLEVSLFDRFFKDRKIADCHVEVGDDDQPIAAFISIARLFLEKCERFEVYRSAAFSGMFPLEGISRAKKRPWSLYELFAEMIIVRMLNCENVDRVSDRCARLARSWLKHHQLGYKKQNMYEMNEDGMIVLNTEMEREEFLPNLVSVLDLHIMLGHAVAPNRHIGAVVIALFRGAMRAIKTGKVPGIARAPDNSLVEVEQVEMIRQSGGKCRVRATRKLKEVSVALIGMTLILGAAAIMWRLDGKVEAIAMGASAVPFGIAILSIAIKIFHDRDLNDWIAGYQTVTRLSEIKRDFKGDWRRVLLEPFVESKLAPVNACLFSTELRGTIVVDDPFSVPELESMGFEFALEDSGHLGLRAPSRKFRRVVLIENGLHVTKEFCTGRMWSFRASDTPLAFHVITCASRHSGDTSHGTDCGTEFELENGQLA